MSIKDKFAVLKFNSEPIKPAEEVLLSEEWSRLLSQIELVYPEMHQFCAWLVKQRAQIRNEGSSEKRIVLDGDSFKSLPTITIEINPERRWPDGAMLLK